MDTLKPTESNTVTGEAFFNREIERKLVLEKIENGEPLLLTGQRRMGKSSLAREIGRALIEEKSDEWSYVFVDIQSCSSGAELVARLAEEIHKHVDFSSNIKSWLKPMQKFFSSVEEVSAGEFSIKLREYLNDSNWQQKGRELLQEIESSEKRTLLVLDEFPDVINKIYKQEQTEGVARLLDWLRPEIQATVPNNKISIILSGSIGLEPLLQRMKLTVKINQMAIYRLKPWKRAIAKKCFEALANYKQRKVDDEVFEYFLDQLGIYIPQHIQQCWGRLDAYLLEEGKESAIKQDAEHVFQNIILRSDSDRMISHYENRLQETLGEQYYPVAIQLLDRMCDGSVLAANDAKLFKQELSEQIDIHYLLSVLTHDGYLDQEGMSWSFNDSLLRKWWQGRKQFRS